MTSERSKNHAKWRCCLE